LNETFDVAKAGEAYTSVNTVLGAHFKIDTVETDVAFADYQVPNVIANNVGVTMDVYGKLTIADHKLPISYGKVLRIGLDAVIIPMIDSNAANLDQLLADKIDCQAVGQGIADALGFGTASAFASACTSGLHVGAQTIYSKITDIDASVLEFG